MDQVEYYNHPHVEEPLKASEILFHNIESPLYHNMESPDEKFGILRLKVAPKPDGSIDTPKIAIVFTIDTSASMTDYCSDNRRKLDHAVQTLIGIMQYLADTNAEVVVAVLTFSSKVKHIIDFTRISSENLQSIIHTLLKIGAQDSTNIEAAIKAANQVLIEYAIQNPNTKLYHIQLTDGEVTDGEKDHDKLAQLVNPEYTNIFVGFGKYHDDRLLCRLSENPRNDYRFIDKLEFSKVVYGEIMYNILYHKYDELEIEVHGAQIYNWRTNQWGNQITIHNIPYDCERIFHLRTNTVTDPTSSVEAFVWTMPPGGYPNIIYCYPELIDMESNEREVRDLTRYSFRQRTQELLYEVREFIRYQKEAVEELSRRGSMDSLPDDHYLSPESSNKTPLGVDDLISKKEKQDKKENIEKQKRVLYDKCRVFMRTIKEYMETHDAKDDRSLRVLQDDIYIVLKTLYRRNAHMWCTTRHNSLGREHSYQPTQGFDADDEMSIFDMDLDDATTMPYPIRPKLRRNARPQVFYTTRDSPVYTFPLFDHPLDTPDIMGGGWCAGDGDMARYEMSQNFDLSMMSPTLARTIDAVVGDISGM